MSAPSLRVRVQWDPERSLRGAKLEQRSIQVGLGRGMIQEYAARWIVGLTDITPRAAWIHQLLQAGDVEHARRLLPVERRYPLPPAIARRDAGWRWRPSEVHVLPFRPRPEEEKMADLSPFTLIETSTGNFSLLLSEFSPADQAFTEAGYEGGGYSWEGVAKYLVQSSAPELERRFNYDPEASMFCAYGDDRAALEALGALMSRAFHDLDVLRQILSAADPELFDD